MSRHSTLTKLNARIDFATGFLSSAPAPRRIHLALGHRSGGSDSKGDSSQTIGGNEHDSVGMKEVLLISKGRVPIVDGLYISVMKLSND